ncbi:Protein distal antenna [Operophtera brumata]|uniref:Protein distal antenna n=1 Tax=Operophtera brumata TaxID=104452 RepID=A0A0L7KPC0_OPEBR|nr:Protein distal antenna [Operophtera brumata]
MSAISPLSGLGHLPGLTHSHLGLSFNEIATNLSLLAQLNPALSTLSAQPASRALRSVRSPKPAHNGVHNLSESKHRSKSHHSDPYRHSSKSSHHHVSSSTASQPVDDTLWYWLKTQQAMLDLTAQTTTAHPMQLSKASEPSLHPKPVPPAATPMNSHLDYNRNSWLWQYYKQFGGAMPLHDDKHKPAALVPKDKTAENILYSQLIKGKAEEERTVATSPLSLVQMQPQNEESRVISNGEPRFTEPVAIASPGIGTENKEPTSERNHDSGRSQAKARTVLDNLLFNNSNQSATAETRSPVGANGEWEEGAADALEHGDKFLAWLEASGDPSVTRMHVHQLRALMHNLRARRLPAHMQADLQDLAARRK